MIRSLLCYRTGALIAAGIGVVILAGSGRSAARAAEPLRIQMLSGTKEYQSEPSLVKLKEDLEKSYRVACTISRGHDGCNDFPDIEALDRADVLVVFCRRTRPVQQQLEKIKQWCAEGKPVVGIRTASHAFQDWLAFDKEVLGGDYKGHYGRDESVRVSIAEGAAGHPILEGIGPWTRPGKLYKNPDLADDVTLLLIGEGKNATEPLAWCRTYHQQNGGRSFYTSMGLPADFDDERFLKLVAGAIWWTAKRPIEKR